MAFAMTIPIYTLEFQVLHHIAQLDGQPASASSIATALDVGRGTVDRHLRRLAHAQLIIDPGTWSNDGKCYELTEKAQQLINQYAPDGNHGSSA